MTRHRRALALMAGEDDAGWRLEQLFDENFDAVFAFCHIRTGSRPLAEEIASDVFCDAVRTLTADPDRELHRGWLVATARSRLVDHWRSAERNRRRVERIAAFGEPVRSESAGPHALIDDERIMAVLASLPERQRAVLILRYLDELSVSEVADALGLSYRATESLLARGRRSFARSYEEGRTR